MRKGLSALALALALCCISAEAQSSNVLDAFSLDLKQFLATHPYASVLLKSAVARASTNRLIKLHYFPENKPAARSFIYFPTGSVVHIQIAERQSPLDEFIGVLFETINCESEKLFKAIRVKAAQGALAKSDYALEMLKVEFVAVKSTRDLLGKIDFTPQEITNSRFFRAFRRCPENFDDFLADLQKRRSPERDPIGDYESEYAALQIKPK